MRTKITLGEDESLRLTEGEGFEPSLEAAFFNLTNEKNKYFPAGSMLMPPKTIWISDDNMAGIWSLSGTFEWHETNSRIYNTGTKFRGSYDVHRIARAFSRAGLSGLTKNYETLARNANANGLYNTFLRREFWLNKIAAVRISPKPNQEKPQSRAQSHDVELWLFNAEDASVNVETKLYTNDLLHFDATGKFKRSALESVWGSVGDKGICMAYVDGTARQSMDTSSYMAYIDKKISDNGLYIVDGVYAVGRDGITPGSLTTYTGEPIDEAFVDNKLSPEHPKYNDIKAAIREPDGLLPLDYLEMLNFGPDAKPEDYTINHFKSICNLGEFINSISAKDKLRFKSIKDIFSY